uniref:Uncharacterized protein n=1 Tax=Oryza brachyantha TaxID=4533 RepID=J3MT02_ORYBR
MRVDVFMGYSENPMPAAAGVEEGKKRRARKKNKAFSGEVLLRWPGGPARDLYANTKISQGPQCENSKKWAG